MALAHLMRGPPAEAAEENSSSSVRSGGGDGGESEVKDRHESPARGSPKPHGPAGWWAEYWRSEQYQTQQKARANGAAAASMCFDTYFHSVAELQRFVAGPACLPPDRTVAANELVRRAVDCGVQLLMITSPASPILPLSAHHSESVALPCCCCL